MAPEEPLPTAEKQHLHHDDGIIIIINITAKEEEEVIRYF
jgi:hypothetical protein